MSTRRDNIVKTVVDERIKQCSLPGSEYDLKREPNDWLSIAGSYLFSAATTKNLPTTQEDFEDALVKAAAVIIAALEHTEYMKKNKKLR
jgi:hypothetical protein